MEPLATGPTATWADYPALSTQQRIEILNGTVYAMTAPSLAHQFLCTRLCELLPAYFREKGCQVFTSPVDVKLSETDVVQPDLVVVCDRSQLQGSHIEGPPALVVEVLSLSSRARDRVRKLRLYAETGVREYWLIEPSDQVVEVLLLDGNSYRIVGPFSATDTLTSPSFEDLVLPLEQLFSTEFGLLLSNDDR